MRVITGWIHEMQATGLSAKTRKNVHGLLSAALKTATVLGYRDDNRAVASRCRSRPQRMTTCACSPTPKRSFSSTRSRPSTGC
jgi:hypothetical protein